MGPFWVLPDQHSQRQLDADAGICAHQGGADVHVAEDQQDVRFQFDVCFAASGGMVDAREQLQAMRVQRVTQPRLDLIGAIGGGISTMCSPCPRRRDRRWNQSLAPGGYCRARPVRRRAPTSPVWVRRISSLLANSRCSDAEGLWIRRGFNPRESRFGDFPPAAVDGQRMAPPLELLELGDRVRVPVLLER